MQQTGAGMHWVDEGTGPVVLALHGLFGGVGNWAGLLAYLKHRCRVIVPVLPLYSLPAAETNIEELVRFVHRFVEHLEVADLNLVGHSLGGQIALLYARIHGDRIRTITLTASAGLGENSIVGTLLPGGVAPRKTDYALVRRKVEQTFYDPGMATPEIVNEIYAFVNNDDRTKAANVVSIVKSAMRRTMDAELPQIQHPTCLIWGRDDVITPGSVAEEFRRLLPNSEVFWIDNCGHVPMMEHPEAFNEILCRWYERQGVLGRDNVDARA